MTKPPSVLANAAQCEAPPPGPAFVVWLTGLSGAGKSSLAHELESGLRRLFLPAVILDGDAMRTGLCSDLGFSPADRRENVRRVAEVAKLFAHNGWITIAALISPLRSDRQLAKEIIGDKRFSEVYCKCPLEVCEARDVKGLYQRARNGEILHFTGIDSPYEAPLHADFEVDTEHGSLVDCADTLLNFIDRKYLQTRKRR